MVGDISGVGCENTNLGKKYDGAQTYALGPHDVGRQVAAMYEDNAVGGETRHGTMTIVLLLPW